MKPGTMGPCALLLRLLSTYEWRDQQLKSRWLEALAPLANTLPVEQQGVWIAAFALGVARNACAIGCELAGLPEAAASCRRCCDLESAREVLLGIEKMDIPSGPRMLLPRAMPDGMTDPADQAVWGLVESVRQFSACEDGDRVVAELASAAYGAFASLSRAA